MSYPDYDYFEPEPSEADQLFDEIKERIRSQVKQEIDDELAALRTKTREMSEQLDNLRTLEQGAERAKREYERQLTYAEQDAQAKVRKMKLQELLALVCEPRYALRHAYSQLPKCEHCNENRQLEYTTPRGRAATEPCECATRTMYCAVEEQLAHEVSKRNGEVLVWYTPVSQYTSRSDSDYFGSPKVLQSPEGIALDDLMKHPYDYGYSTAEAAQTVADALNAKALA